MLNLVFAVLLAQQPLTDVSDWVHVGGQAAYTFNDGELHGVGATNGNAFLHSPREYSDFVLECDVKISPGGNSGIQFRSHVRDNGRLYGYQCEIDSSNRWISGGIYDEARRGWLEDLRDESESLARGAFVQGTWNHYKIKAQGSHIQTWINGIACSDIRDDVDAAGLIAFQVHGGDVTDIRWKNIVITELPPAPFIHSISDISQQFSFYMDGRFFTQYIKGDGVDARNWGTLSKLDLSNTNLLLLDGGERRIPYAQNSIEHIASYVNEGGTVLVMADHSADGPSVLPLIKHFEGGLSKSKAVAPFTAAPSLAAQDIEYYGGKTLALNNAWTHLIKDKKGRPLLARRAFGDGNVLLGSRGLFGHKPDHSDPINAQWVRPLLLNLVQSKVIDETKAHRGQSAELSKQLGPLKLEFNAGTAPFADAIAAEYELVRPHLVEITGVEPAPGMIKNLLILPTGGGGFSSGQRIAIGAFWGNYPEKRYPMVELISHEAGHSWVLPYAEPLWNEPIATYLGIKVGQRLGMPEADQTLARAIKNARDLDPEMNALDPLAADAPRNLIWGKSYFVFEELERKYGPGVMAKYFRAKRELLPVGGARNSYTFDECVAVWSVALGEDLVPWFQSLGFSVAAVKLN
ncbi:MAG: DUF1080 domain-containing protein [Planctomycetes bacterium]|nr:DUF1080 domain-containing protein [Planctomycetota bacterium]